jgi:large subunit ribosomal protein L25
MKTFQLNAEPRTDLGKKAAKALRASQKIPCVLNGGKVVELKDGKYEGTLAEGEKVVEIGRDGKGVITTDFTVNFSDVRKLIYTPDVFVVALNLNGVEKMAVLKDIQWHPVNDSILHLDFLEVTEDKPVIVPVPVKIEGHAVGVKAGGKLFLSMKKVKVKGIYTDIPERIVVNVNDIAIGHAIKVGDLKFDKFELANSKDLVITGVRATRAAAAAAAESEEGEESEAAAE